MMAKKFRRGLVWFRGSDLRTADNLPLTDAHDQCDEVAHLCFINPSIFRPVSDEGPKMGWKRFLFFYEAICDLHQNLTLYDTQLILAVGDPVVVIPQFCLTNGFTDLYYFDEPVHDEKVESQLLKTSLTDSIPEFEVHVYWGGGTLLSPTKLPFPIESLSSYTDFRMGVEEKCLLQQILAPLELPVLWKPEPSALECSLLDSCVVKRLSDGDFYYHFFQLWDSFCQLQGKEEWKLLPVGLNQEDARRFIDMRSDTSCSSISSFPWKGGENNARQRLSGYFSSDSISSYRQERNGMIGTEYSTKLSPFLALGCLSSTQIFCEIQRYEERVSGRDENTSLLVAELLWRDYMRFYSLKYGNKLFLLGGVQGQIGRNKHVWSRNFELFKLWVDGKTGYPTVDAHMKELAATGYMSNRGRQIVASFLVRDLKLDWRLGAEVFERLLLDYDPCSNYGKRDLC
jgi:deoxyribodipyrimidine photo-lyase